MTLRKGNEKCCCFSGLPWRRLKTLRCRKRNNTNISLRDCTEKIERLENKVLTLTQTIETLSTKMTQAAVGFSAFVPYNTDVSTESILNCFQLVKCNLGNCFNPSTGVFTAPEDGLYFACVTLDTATAEKVDVLVVKEGQGVRDVVVKGGASVPGTCACGTTVFTMHRSQTLFVKCIGSGRCRTLSCFSNFVCFKIA